MIPRIRKIKEAMAEIQKQDPESAITEHYLRQLCKTGQIPTSRSGTDYLINLDTLEQFLESQTSFQK